MFCIANNRHGVTITTHAIKRHFLIWMTTVRQPTKRRRSCVLTLKYTFICVYWWTRQRIHNTLIVLDRYLRLMGDKTIPDSAEPRLESFYPPFVAGIDLPHQGVVDSYNPPFVAGIDLPHQGVVDSYNLHDGISYTGKMASWYCIRAQFLKMRNVEWDISQDLVGCFEWRHPIQNDDPDTNDSLRNLEENVPGCAVITLSVDDIARGIFRYSGEQVWVSYIHGTSTRRFETHIRIQVCLEII